MRVLTGGGLQRREVGGEKCLSGALKCQREQGRLAHSPTLEGNPTWHSPLNWLGNLEGIPRTPGAMFQGLRTGMV